MLTITPNPLVAGGTATVQISGSSKGGSTVEVEVSDGTGQTDVVSVTIDANGNGTGTWNEVPSDWDSATFEYGKCDPVAVQIEQSGQAAL